MRVNLDGYDRDRINEGVRTGLGFALAIKNDNVYDLISPISACKDNLNSFAWFRHINEYITQYGCEFDPEYHDANCYDEEGVFHLICNVLTSCTKQVCSMDDFQKSTIPMANLLTRAVYHQDDLRIALNVLADKYGTKKFKIRRLENVPHGFALECDLKWMNTISISVLTSYIRLLIHLDLRYSDDPKLDIVKHINEINQMGKFVPRQIPIRYRHTMTYDERNRYSMALAFNNKSFNQRVAHEYARSLIWFFTLFPNKLPVTDYVNITEGSFHQPDQETLDYYSESDSERQERCFIEAKNQGIHNFGVQSFKEHFDEYQKYIT